MAAVIVAESPWKRLVAASWEVFSDPLQYALNS